MALYGKKTILLVERGVALPTNPQGLYRCEYEGDRLDYESRPAAVNSVSRTRLSRQPGRITAAAAPAIGPLAPSSLPLGDLPVSLA